ncbi:MAG: bifunctional [glutamate--ammonia ligase]-adenylyl-L-tyrosine phosphorylase/[glutamate--ammonia-ligase] adenylyltransferase [Pseudomonadota bacterium]|nr:bifunctional [glutamate--ammonia ligase]-adenylyl-L-tyrosine phosphorylase/[glutamate--ammonia-ligase] adenylyltransferase [Pseudomonadota bacterium]
MQNSDDATVLELPDAVLEQLPQLLRDSVSQQWRDFVLNAQKQGIEVSHNDEFLTVLARVWASSEFVAKTCLRYPELLVELLASGDLMNSYAPQRQREALLPTLAGVSNDAGLGVVLRHYRRREMVRIAWRDIAGWALLAESLSDLSALASACVDVALEQLHRWQSQERGTPHGEQSALPQSMVVLGMGKLGADELNFSSDIDLIFAYPEEGETDGAHPLSNGEYFLRLGQRLISVINQPTAEGFVFRVDMRLRPFGEAGPLAISFDAMENYYQTHGREWERYAMIKAGVVAGDQAAGAELLQRLRPFIYRRYLDYGVFESLREMKTMISREVQRKGMEGNVKLGPGGIREVEFIGQTYQLIHGGRNPRLQIRPIQPVLNVIADEQYLPQYVVTALQSAYLLLRNTENRIQSIADQQTHELPSSEIDRQRLVLAMGYQRWSDFETDLHKHMGTVHSHFEQVFTAPQRDQAAAQGSVFDDVWRADESTTASDITLTANAYEQPEEALRLLERLREGSAYKNMSARGKERMDRLMPLLLGAVAATEQPTVALARLIPLIEAILRRTAYLALLVENPMALSQLVRLCAASPWVAVQLARHPLLLDELLDPRTLYSPPTRADLEAELQQMLDHVGDDQEQQMELLRRFKLTNVLRVAATDVMEVYPLMVISDHLTEVAEVVVNAVVRLAYAYLVAKHGRPHCAVDAQEPGFIVIAYGKLGGIELGYSSDLDLVFIHGSRGDMQVTTGESVVDNSVFFARLGQRIIHMMTARTPSGMLYETDARLRPSGEAGMLVSGIDAFIQYQRASAWTWEHQALVRARVVAGDEGLREQFAAVRSEVLGRQRDAAQLQREVREMRQKMRDALAKSKPGQFDLKQDAGGIADIEFIVQYGVLRWAHDHPALLRWSDTIRLLETLAHEGLLAEADATLLADGYRAYRVEVHRRALQEQGTVVDEAPYAEWRQGVTRIWRELLEPVE